MFIPFLPLILAALALSLVVFDPSRSEGMIDLSLFQYAGILLSGSLLLAQLTLFFEVGLESITSPLRGMFGMPASIFQGC